MKKFILLLLAFCICALAISCNKDNGSSGDNSGGEQIPFPCDYAINAQGRDVRILQITDTQIFEDDDAALNEKCFKYVNYAVEQTNPDLIIVTGDIIYGRYDKTGSVFKKIVAYFESLNIPWAPVFGNHDNESPFGTENQCQLLENSKNCLFERRTKLGGNGNYSIGICVQGKLVRTLYMIDTQGCNQIDGTTAKKIAAIGPEQVKFIQQTQLAAEKYAGEKIKGMVAMHIMPSFIASAVKTKYGVNITDLKTYDIPQNDGGDFGGFGQKFTLSIDVQSNAYYAFKDAGIDGIFAGHEHLNDASVEYGGVRMTYGLKSSTCDAYSILKLGGTLINANKTFTVSHCYYPSPF